MDNCGKEEERGEEGRRKGHTELDDHFPIVNSDIVFFQLSLIANALKELGLLGIVLELGLNRLLVVALGLDLLNSLERLTFSPRHDDFHGQVDNLRSDGKVDNLFRQPVWINLPALGGQGDTFRGEFLHSELEDIEVRDQDLGEWDINEGGQEDSEVGGYEVDDEDLLHEGGHMGVLCLVVFQLGEALGQYGKEGGEGRVENGEDDGWEEGLKVSQRRPGTSSRRGGGGEIGKIGMGEREFVDRRKRIICPESLNRLNRSGTDQWEFFFFFCFLGESCRWWQPVGQSHCETNLEQFGVAGSTGPRGWSRFSPGSFSFSRSLFLEMGPPAKGLGTVLQAVNELMMDCSVVRLCKLASMS